MHIGSILRVCAVALACGVTASAATATSVAFLQLQSSPGDYIGQGQSWNLTYDAANLVPYESFSVQPGLSIDGTPSYVTFSMGLVTGADATNTWSLLQFSTTQLGLGLQPGVYSDVERAPFASSGHAGLDISFQNRGCDTVSGSMTIESAVFSGSTLQNFVVDFTQHCEHSPTTFLNGRFAYYLDAADAPPIPGVPEPASWALLLAGLAGVGFGARVAASRQPTMDGLAAVRGFSRPSTNP